MKAAHQNCGRLGEMGRAISMLPVASMRPLVTTPFTTGPSVRYA